MKKVLSVLGLIAILSMTTPVMAAPGGHGHGGPSGHHGGGHRIQAGAHHRPHIAPHHSHHHPGGVMIHTGHYPRHSYWHGYRHDYWGSTWCDYRLGYCTPYYYSPHAGIYFPVGGAGVSIRF